MTYQNKYLKYKSKYLNYYLTGGAFPYIFSRSLEEKRNILIKKLSVLQQVLNVLYKDSGEYPTHSQRAEIEKTFLDMNKIIDNSSNIELLADKKTVLMIIDINPEFFKYANPILKNDKETVIAAIKKNIITFTHMSDELKNDNTFIEHFKELKILV